MTIDIFDFDNTIYSGNSSVDFYLFCVRKNPRILKNLPYQIRHLFRYLFRFENKTKMKTALFVFLSDMKNRDSILLDFWKLHFKNIKKWYILRDHSRDVIISASPEFLLDPVIKKLNAYKLIGTKINPRTGVIIGKNCFGEEKLKRLRRSFKEFDVAEAYSDHLSDMPILKLARKRYIVKGNRIVSLEKFKQKFS